MKSGISLVLFIICLFVFTGCASVKESIKGFAGVSTKALEENRNSANFKNFNLDYFSSYTRSLDALKSINCYIYAQNIKKHMIAAYISEEDTTPVGVFFKEINFSNTRIEVSSPSTNAKELISEKLFLALDKETGAKQQK